MQVEALQERLIDLEEEAIAARSVNTETQRLTDENALLASQLRQMEVNIQVSPPVPSTCFSPHLSQAATAFHGI